MNNLHKVAVATFTFLIILFSQLSIQSAESRGGFNADRNHWIGTWTTAAQPSLPKFQTYRNQSLRLIVHSTVGGGKVRIKLSNTYGEQPLIIGAAHIARRSSAADIDPASDRALMFRGRSSVTIPARSMVVSDPADLDVPALSDLAISLFLPQPTPVTTVHSLSKQTNYVSAETGDHTWDTKFPVGKTLHNWPFLTAVEVAASSRAAAIVAFGSSLTDGDGTTEDTNQRWPDVLAKRLQQNGQLELSVLNEGIIGNRLLNDSPSEAAGGLFGTVLGEAGLKRFQRDVLDQPGVKYVVIGVGINDIAFPGSLTPTTENITAEKLIAGYRQLIALAHRKGVRVIGTTNPAFENAFLELPPPAGRITFYNSDKEKVRQKVNDWILKSGEFDGVVDLDAVLRDPNHATQLLPAYDSGDHIHPNDAGSVVEANAFPLSLFAK